MKSVIPEDQAKEILNGIMRCLKDPMPNVRMSAIEPFQQFSNIVRFWGKLKVRKI